MSPSAPNEDAASGQESTRRLLVCAALELFSRHGIEAVTMAKVRDTVGVGNRSVIHYYFQNKAGLVQAVLDEVNALFAPLQAEALQELLAIQSERAPTVREIVGIGFAPFVLLSQQSRQGAMALRVLSRLTWESGPEAQALLVKAVRPYMLKLSPLFKAALPDKPSDALAFQVYLAVASLIHGLSDISVLAQEPEYGINALYRERPRDLLRYFNSYITAGLCSELE